MTSALAGKTIIVTGAARGLGRVMALALAAAGAAVGAIDLPSAAAEMDDLVRAANGAINPLLADITVERDVQSTIDRIATPLFGLVNNAGRGMQEIGPVQMTPRKPFHQVPVDQWRGVIEVNLIGAFIMARCAAPRMIAAGAGRIVNITTSFRTMQAQGFSPYGPSKAGLEAATVIWARDLAGTGVTVNALLPGGAADTRMIPTHETPDRSQLVQPAVMAAPITWLMSDAAAAITGARIVGQLWNPSLPADEAFKAASAPAGFPA